MHHLIYPSQDTYITNEPIYAEKNFGLDEILTVGAQNKDSIQLNNTKDYLYSNVHVVNLGVNSFYGTASNSSLSGTSSYISGTIVSSGSIISFTTDYFSGSLIGSISGSETGSSIYSLDFSGSLIDFSGNIFTYMSSSNLTGSINGIISGSLKAKCEEFFVFNGYIENLNGTIFYGTITGIDARPFQNYTVNTKRTIERALIKFDISEISKSISNGDIVDPHFKLRLKSVMALNLPISYTIYAFPISQNWNMGNGYLSDGGSNYGTSWFFRDQNNGNLWYSPISSASYAIDYITYPNLINEVFARGGATWYTSSICSQSFDYEAADINMDVDSIVYAWLSGSIPNNGFIIVSSDELHSSGSNSQLEFFSKDTNTIYWPTLDVGWIGGPIGFSWITGSESTSSVQISTINSGITASIQSGSTFTIAGGISGNFSASSTLIITENYSASILLDYLSGSGFLVGKGYSGNINGLPIFGFISTSLSLTQSTITGECGKTFNVQLATGSFQDGIFSGSQFWGYYMDYQFQNCFLTGSWNEAALLGASVNITIPSGIDPYAFANVYGPYINGTALGIYQISGSTSASFSGQFINGNLIGGYLNLQLSGSVYTSSYSYTSSVQITSSVLQSISFDKPFSIIIHDLQPTMKSDNIVRINVFAREKFPLKNFNRQTQFSQFLIPKYLPETTYYAIKDNETEQIVLDFDNYTQVNCDLNGNYFLLDTSGLAQERYYRVLIKTEYSGSSYSFDNGDIFKIVR